MSNTSTVNFGATVSVDELATLLKVCGKDTRILARGEAGIGKSSIMAALERHFGGAYAYAYFDCVNKDLGDVVMPSTNRELRVTEYFPNAVFQLQTGKPIIAMLDEFTKAPQPIQNMLHPMLESRNPRLGDIPLPEGSIVFLTGNMGSDGVGDNLKMHTVNRVTTVTVRKPNAEEWLAWAVNNGIDPVIMAWVNQFPHCMESYLTGDQDSNPYIFNPKKTQGAFVSPRSLELVSRITKERDKLSTNTLLAAMIGTVGASAARDMEAYLAYQDQLDPWETIIANPAKARVPDSPGACAVMVFGAVTKIDKTTISPFMEYIERMEPEWQAVFAASVAANPDRCMIAFNSRKFSDWVSRNEDVL